MHVDASTAVDQRGEPSLTPSLRGSRRQALVGRVRVRQHLGGHEPVEQLPQGHGRVVGLDDGGGLVYDLGPVDAGRRSVHIRRWAGIFRVDIALVPFAPSVPAGGASYFTDGWVARNTGVSGSAGLRWLGTGPRQERDDRPARAREMQNRAGRKSHNLSSRPQQRRRN